MKWVKMYMQTVMNTWRFKDRCFLFVQQTVVFVLIFAFAFSDLQSKINLPFLPAVGDSHNSAAVIIEGTTDHDLEVVVVGDGAEVSVNHLDYQMSLSLDKSTLNIIGGE
jgi:hypothetical protein